jgi:hypothetical protein
MATDHPFGHSAGMWAFLGTPKLADLDWFYVSGNMKAGAYVPAHANSGDSPALARNITVKRVMVGGLDTGGTFTITGTSVQGDVITEDIVVGADGVTVAGTKAFLTVTAITNVGWVIGAVGADTVEIGFGNLIGLPWDVANTIRLGGHTPDGLVGGVLAVPTIVTDADEPEKNTVDLSSGTFNGSKEVYLLVVTF